MGWYKWRSAHAHASRRTLPCSRRNETQRAIAASRAGSSQRRLRAGGHARKKAMSMKNLPMKQAMSMLRMLHKATTPHVTPICHDHLLRPPEQMPQAHTTRSTNAGEKRRSVKANHIMSMKMACANNVPTSGASPGARGPRTGLEEEKGRIKHGWPIKFYLLPAAFGQLAGPPRGNAPRVRAAGARPECVPGVCSRSACPECVTRVRSVCPECVPAMCPERARPTLACPLKHTFFDPGTCSPRSGPIPLHVR